MPRQSKPRRHKHREPVRRPVNLDGLADVLHEKVGSLFNGPGTDGTATVGANDTEQE